MVTRVRDVAGREWLESRVVVALSPSDGLARRQAQHLTVGIDLTVRAVLAGALPSDLVDDLLGRVPAVGPVAA